MSKLELSKIVIDENLYPRGHFSEFNVQRLALAGETGATFPPLVVEVKTHRLVDGRHRYEVYKRKGVAKVEVVEKKYADEAELFADAVRLNIGHGQTLDQYTIRNAIVRLQQYGYKREQISEVVRLPPESIEKIERGFASNQQGEPVALKGGLSHMRGETLTPQQQDVNRKYSGGKATFHLQQLCRLIEADMWPRSEGFEQGMTRLIELWTQRAQAPSASSAA
jgi:hypothetical protein